MITKLTAFQRQVNLAVLLAGIFSAASAFATPQVATPIFSPAAGVYSVAQSVEITSATSGASIAYTTDGSIPTESGGTITHGTLYSGAITVSDTTLSAIAFENGYADSSVAISGYTLPTAVPTFAPLIANLPDAAPDFATLPLVTLPTPNVLYNFPISASDGNTPALELAQGNDGDFYGMTSAGGANGLGTIFKITPTGSLTTLVSFTGTTGAFLGSNPHGVLALDSDGNIYGTTGSGGTSNFGTAFKLTPSGAFTTLVSFTGTNGSDPRGVILGSDGNLYGVTEAGGSTYVSPANQGVGTGFKLALTPSPTLTTLLSFDGVHNGQFPDGSLVQGSDGNFYGATVDGLIGNTMGTIFSMTPSGVVTTLATFTGLNGYGPRGGLMQGSDGNFYGTTNTGGSTYVSPSIQGYGTVFKITSGGTLTSLVSFTGPNGAYPRSRLLQGTDGNFYGATGNGGSSYVSATSPGYGTVFQMTPAGVLTTLVSFNLTNGTAPFGGLVQSTDGNFYGVTQTGGTSNVGVFYQLLMAAAPIFSPAAGTYTSAQTVTITSATIGASIHYTTDGSSPTETSGTLYSGPVSISATTTLNAIAFLSGDLNSPVTSGTFTINIPAPTPTPTPAAPAASGGGGAPSYWFLGFLAFAGILRWKFRKIQALT